VALSTDDFPSRRAHVLILSYASVLATHGRTPGLFLNNGGGKLTLPAASTSGSSTSRGPASLLPTCTPRSRDGPDGRAAPSPSPLPSLSAQRLRTLVSADAAASTLLRSRLPTGRTPLASLAGQPTLSRFRPRQTTTPGPEPALPRARAAAACRARDRDAAATGRDRRQAARGGRGPAPSRISRTKCRPTLPASRLLHVLCSGGAFAPATFLLPLVPSGFTTRPPTRSRTPATAATGCAAASWSVTATALSSPPYVVAYCKCRLLGTILSRPPTQREERVGR
jgi:hypothetical protein